MKTVFVQSLEWQCFNAAAIVHCKITSCEMGKINNTAIEKVSFKVKDIYKGGNSVKKGELFFHTSNGGLSFKKHLNHDCVIFIHFKKNSSGEYQIIPADKSPENAIIDFDESNYASYTSDFKVLAKKSDILKKIKEIVINEDQYYKQTPGLKIKKALLDIPLESEAYKHLFQGSACFMYVPDAMFPKAELAK